MRLWTLTLGTLRPKNTETAEACLNRLTNERKDVRRLRLTADTVDLRLEQWPLERLQTLDWKHQKIHHFDDDRAIVVIDLDERKLLVDGNHRVARWLMKADPRTYPVILVKPTDSARDS
jgi:hypothetical protein